MSIAFKRFHFFQTQELPQHCYPRNATCSCPTDALLYVGCDNGSVQAMDHSMHVVFSFSAHSYKVFELFWLEHHNLLLSIGSEEPGYSSAMIKLWDLSKASSGTSGPGVSLGSTKVFSSKYKESEITVVAVQEGPLGGLFVAIGLASGMVYIMTGDLSGGARHAGHIKLHHGSKLSARPDQGEPWAVTGLAFQGGDTTHLMSLFVVTESQTLSFNLQTAAKTILDHSGALVPNCCVMRNGLLVVARDEGLYNYTLDTRAGCSVFEGKKQMLSVLRRFLVVVSKETSEVGATSSTVHLVDVRSKMVAGHLVMTNVTTVVPAWEGLLVVTGSGKAMMMTEVDLVSQLNTLFRRSMHKLALDVARAHRVEDATIATIQQRWGDHLYSKGEYDAAMTQYLETISFLEPSYVIRRFLDAQRIHNLTAYLEQLHSRGLATADHTTLLLNCYTKLKDVDKLDAFIQRDSKEGGKEGKGGKEAAGSQPTSPKSAALFATNTPLSLTFGGGYAPPQAQAHGGSQAKEERRHKKEILHAGGSGRLKFDAETAIKVLRAAGYYHHALSVARAAGQSSWVLDILLDDCHSYNEAVEFLSMMPPRESAAALRKYGKVLISHRPEDTTRLLMELCMPAVDADSAGDDFVASVADFAHLYSDRPTALMLLCEFILNSSQGMVLPNERLLLHTLLELYLTHTLPDEQQQAHAEVSTSAEGEGDSSSATARLSSSLAGEAGELGQAVDEEMREQAELLRLTRQTKALDLIQGGWPPHLVEPKYDADHALMLCRLHHFTDGLVFLYDKMRLAREVLQIYMNENNHGGLINACMKYGDASKGGDPQLWAEVLEYFVLQPGDCTAQVVEVVEHIESGKILPPLVVLQTLAKNREMKVSTIRGYVARQLGRETLDIAKDREQIARLSAETAAMREEISKLRTQPRVFQSSKCSATGQPLELPVVHFLCGHSFNLRSMGENEKECPICTPDFRRVFEIRRNMAASALHQDRFFTELRENADGFSVVAEHFGRGLMNMTAGATQVARELC